RSAVLRRPDHAHQAHLAQLGEDLARELLLLVPFPRVRSQLRLCELADRLPQELLVLTQAEIQGLPPRASRDFDRSPAPSRPSMLAAHYDASRKGDAVHHEKSPGHYRPHRV